MDRSSAGMTAAKEGWGMMLKHAAFLALAYALLAAVLVAAPMRVEAAASRELVRLSLLDSCVLQESQMRADDSRIADECKCAARKAAGQLSSQQIAAYKNKLDKPGMAVWTAATKTCFKSATASSKP
jgi:hypothetical protein